MEKTRGAVKRIAALEPFDKRRVDVTKFKPDLSPKEVAALFGFPGSFLF